MRIALGSFLQESNSFTPVSSGWQHYGPHELLRGADLVAHFDRSRAELGGALALAREEGIAAVPLLSARPAASAGCIERAVFEAIRDELCSRLAAVQPVDGVLLVLHGAMLAEGYDDATGEVLRAVREVAGPHTPVVATLDLHANVTARMVSEATALVGYHTMPHIDLYETGVRALALLVRTAAGAITPVQTLRRLPMILPGENGRTTDGPYAEVMAQVLAAYARPGLLDASAYLVQPWLDIPDVGCAVLVVTDGARPWAAELAEGLADVFWARRTAFGVERTPMAQAIEAALAAARGPFICSDGADAPSSGAPGDSPAVAAALLAANPERDCFTNLVDPVAAARLAAAGVGAEVELDLGARLAPACYTPLRVRGRVRVVSDGAFVNKTSGLQGVRSQRGPTAVLQVGRVAIVVAERAVIQWDPEFYRSVDLEPCAAQIVVVKSPAAFRAAYEPFAAGIFLLDSPGVCSPDLLSLPFVRIHRPLYPFDPLEDWRG
jgi:microcystin degradation protein MlrC